MNYSMIEPGPLPQFYLKRKEDVSGVSGTGIVAQGVRLPSGKVVLEWTVAPFGITIYSSIAACRKVHGHDGRTEIIFIGGDKL